MNSRGRVLEDMVRFGRLNPSRKRRQLANLASLECLIADRGSDCLVKPLVVARPRNERPIRSLYVMTYRKEEGSGGGDTFSLKVQYVVLGLIFY